MDSLSIFRRASEKPTHIQWDRAGEQRDEEANESGCVINSASALRLATGVIIEIHEESVTGRQLNREEKRRRRPNLQKNSYLLLSPRWSALVIDLVLICLKNEGLCCMEKLLLD
jgi:hypothetical protein